MTMQMNRKDAALLAAMSLAVTLYHLLTSVFPVYGYFIDEFYYVACTKHLAAGYVDHPPLSILLLAANRWLLGDSLPALRFLPAVASGGIVFMTGIVAAQFGGRRGAIIIAALAAAVMPIYLLMGSFYSMNAFEPLVWMAILSLVTAIVDRENPKLWIVVGILAGVGLEIKHTMVLYMAALFLGMLTTPVRRFLWNKWFFAGLAACVILVLPNFAWQVANGFPSLEFYRNAMMNKNIATPPLMVIATQILFANPFALPLWLAGIIWFFFSPSGKRHRYHALTYGVLLLVMIVSGSSRPDRIGAMYALLFAAGAVSLLSIKSTILRRTGIGLTVALLTAGGIIFIPVFTPLYPPDVLKPYLTSLGLSFDIESGKKNEPVPQWLADRLGWEELASDVSEVFHELPSEERRNTAIVSTNYGEAGALELYGPRFDLPPVFATHNSYHTWGPPPDSIRTYIGVFINRDDLVRIFSSVEEVRVHTCADCTLPQRRIPIYVARGPKISIAKNWSGFKTYN